MTENLTEPVKITAGRFALYQTPNGGMHLTLHVDGEPEPRHAEIPAMMVKLAMRGGKGMGPFGDLSAELAARDAVE